MKTGLETLTENDLLVRLVLANDGKIIFTGDEVNALEHELWKRYMPEVNRNITDEELLVLGKKFKSIVTEKETQFRLGDKK